MASTGKAAFAKAASQMAADDTAADATTQPPIAPPAGDLACDLDDGALARELHLAWMRKARGLRRTHTAPTPSLQALL